MMINSIGVLTDDTLYIARPGRHMQKKSLDGTITTVADICDIALECKIRVVWLAPGSSLSSTVARDASTFLAANSAYVARTSYMEVRRGVKLPTFTSIYKTGVYGYVGVAYPENDSRWAEDRADGFALADEENPLDLLVALSYLSETLNMDIMYSPGWSGLSLLKARYPQKECADLTQIPGEWQEGDIRHVRPLTRKEQRMGYIHLYDKNSMYLAAATGAKLGIGDPRPADPYSLKIEDLAKTCGIWHVEIASGWQRYPGLPILAEPGRPEWMISQRVKLLHDMGIALTIDAGYVWDGAAPVLADWAKSLWEARKALKDPDQFRNIIAANEARILIKCIATQTVGWLDIGGGNSLKNPWVRPDYKREIEGLAGVRMGYKMKQLHDQYGLAPLMVKTDLVAYASNERDPRAAFPELVYRKTKEGGLVSSENELGGFKVVDTWPIVPEVAALFDHEQSPEAILKQMKGVYA